LRREGDAVTGADLRDERTGEEITIDAGFTINAGGAWAHEIAEMAGIEGVSVVPGKGIMIAMNHRLVNTVVNRCTMPADGDIIVPIRTVSVIGTTDIRSDHPDDLPVTQEEVDAMLADGERLVPGFRAQRALRVWAGVRPLFDDKKAGGSTRDVSRGTALLDHLERDGVERFITITGGKLTTCRLMAEEAVDAMVEQLGHDRPCTTKTTPLPGSEDGAYMSPGARLRTRDRHLKTEQLICECELIERSTLEATMRARGSRNLDDIRRSLRLGMGPCQGGFCIPRATGILHSLDRLTADQANASMRSFLEERWKGIWPILHGDQLRQARLDDWIFQGVLDVEHLPGGTPEVEGGVRPGSAEEGDLQPTPGTGSAHDSTEGPGA
jgi:glycerol-3-phosphate dehydrogenase